MNSILDKCIKEELRPQIEKLLSNMGEIEIDATIDPLDLHMECRRQPLLYKKHSEVLSNLTYFYENLKADKIVKYREELELQSKKIPSDASVTRCLEGDPELIQFNLLLNIAKGNLRSIETKKTMLEREVELWIGEYFSIPNLPYKIDKSEEVQRRRKQLRFLNKDNTNKGGDNEDSPRN